ncbi:MAG: cyclic nucleotide-binding domain-containing protein, partial [Parachlamydiaceae bacterium]
MKNFDSLVINDFVKTPLFEGIPLKVSKEMLRHFPIIELKSGEVLVREGKIDVCAYVLLHGRISLIKESEHNRVLAELGRGDAIGETSLLKEEPASSTAVAIRNSFVWKISPEIYENFSKAYPKEALKLLQNLIKLEKRDRFYSHRAFFLYVEDNQNAAERIAKRLHDALSTFGLCRTIGKNEAIRYQDHFVEWLFNEHTNNEYCLYLSTKEDFSITRKMLAHSDRVIIYSKAELELSFDAEKIYLEANRLNKACDLILQQKIETKLPKDTQKWLKQAPNVVWHHVKENAQEDFLRVARIISGHAIAFVLGGGGAKSLLYLGFYKAIKELGIPIDWVGGTCAGAMITTAIAMGLSLDDMIDRFKKHAPRNLMNAIDFTFPLVS